MRMMKIINKNRKRKINNYIICPTFIFVSDNEKSPTEPLKLSKQTN